MCGCAGVCVSSMSACLPIRLFVCLSLHVCMCSFANIDMCLISAWLGACVNSGIHVIMYSYYLLAGLGPNFRKFLWWKRYMTTFQLVSKHCFETVTIQVDILIHSHANGNSQAGFHAFSAREVHSHAKRKLASRRPWFPWFPCVLST